MNKKAVFLDIDGTLFLNGLGPFVGDIDAIIEARKAGHAVFLSTGRSLGNLPHIFAGAGYFDGFVLAAGAHVVYDGKTLYCVCVDKKKTREIYDFYSKTDKWCAFEGETGIFAVHSLEHSLFPPNVRRIDSPDDLDTKYGGERMSKITVQGALTKDEELFLRDSFELNIFPNYFEGILKGHGKITGIDIVLGKLGLSREDAVAIGDSMNDMDMVVGCGTGIAMGNACDELKRAAKAVTLDCKDGGVGEAIRRYVLS
jgi:Cof subfamily protein (haloacid dehalogenase superfamily)